MKTGKRLKKPFIVVMLTFYLSVWPLQGVHADDPDDPAASQPACTIDQEKFQSALNELLTDDKITDVKLSVQDDSEENSSTNKKYLNTSCDVWMWYEDEEEGTTRNIYVSSTDHQEIHLTECTNLFGGLDKKTKLKEIDLSGLNTSNAKSMSSMFAGCTALNRLTLSDFDTSNVQDMSSMFADCSGLPELKLDDFNTANVETMNSMFQGCSALKELDISSFDTSGVTDVSSMFCDCQALTTIYVGPGWKLLSSGVTSVDMFKDCTSIQGASGKSYDANKVDATYAVVDADNSAESYLTYKARYRVSAIVEGTQSAWGTVAVKNGKGTVPVMSATQGTKLTLVAAPKSGYRFKEWKITGDDNQTIDLDLGTSTVDSATHVVTNQVTMPDKNLKFQAVFEAEKLELKAANVSFKTVKHASGAAYAQPDAVSIEINNTGNLDAVVTEVQVFDGSSVSEHFTVSEPATEEDKNVAAGSLNKKWTIQPVAQLADKEYGETIRVTYKRKDSTDSTSPQTCTASVTFTVATEKAKLTGVTVNPNTITFAHGTSKAEIINDDRWPETVKVTVQDVANPGDLKVSWVKDDALKEYDPQILTEQTFDVTGSFVALPDGIDPNGKKPEIKIIVEAAAQAVKPEATLPTEIKSEKGAWADNTEYTYFTEKFEVSLATTTEDGTIYYTMGSQEWTTDSKPTADTLTLKEPKVSDNDSDTKTYAQNSPISISGEEGKTMITVIHAITHKENMRDSVLARFTYVVKLPKRYQLSVTTDTTDATGDTITGTVGETSVSNSSYNGREIEGTEVTLQAHAPATYIFQRWEVTVNSGSSFTLSNPSSEKITFKMPAEDVTIKPIFEKKKIELAVEAPSFAAVKKGYTRPAAGTIKITNNGNVTAQIESVSVDSTDFELGGSGTSIATSIAPGESVETRTIRPIAGLGVGSHTGTITVNGSAEQADPASGTADVSLEVQPAELLGITKPTVADVPNGTELAAIMDQLPKQVAITTENQAESLASVTWDQATVTPAYDPGNVEQQNLTVKGKVTVPEEIAYSDQTWYDQSDYVSLDNGNVYVTVQVTVKAADQVKAPKASVSGTPASEDSSYVENLKVTLSTETNDAEMYYTITDNGDDPQDPKSAPEVVRKAYDVSNGISLTGTHTASRTFRIKAYAKKSAMRDSEVATFSYVIKLPPLHTMTVKPQETTADGRTGTGTVTAEWADDADTDSEFQVTTDGGTYTIKATEGTQINLTATSSEKSLFTEWKNGSGGAATFGNAANATTTVTMPGQDTEIQAVFVPRRIALEAEAPTFLMVKEGYSQPDAGQITISNIGNTEADISDVTVSGNGFVLVRSEAQADNGKVPAGGTNTAWTLQPQKGLEKGEHEAKITVFYNDIDGQNAEATAKTKLIVIDKNMPTLSKVGTLAALSEFENGTPWETIEAALPQIAPIDVDIAGIDHPWKAAIDWNIASAKAAYEQDHLDKQTIVIKGIISLQDAKDAEGAMKTVLNVNDAVAPDVELTVTVKRAPQVEMPTETPKAGISYTENQTVTISSNTVGADIYYTSVTFEGEADTGASLPSEPSKDGEDSTKYTEPISLTGEHGKVITTIIKAIAVKDGMWPSETAIFTYTIRLPKFYTLTVTKEGRGTVTATVDGEPVDASAQVIAGMPVTLKAEAADDVLFRGWELTGAEVSLADDTSAVVSFEMPEGDLTVKAVFVTKKITVSFNANGGSGSMAAVTALRGQRMTLPACGFTAPAGKQFKEWAIGSAGGTAAKAGASYTFNEDTTLYAVWENTAAQETGGKTEEPEKAAETYKVTQAVKTANALALNTGLKVKVSATKLSVSWGKVKSADGYQIFAAYAGKKFTTKTATKTITKKTTTSASVTKIGGKKLDAKKNVKLYVVAYKSVGGKKVAIGQSIIAYAAGSQNKTYTNPKKITVAKTKLTLKVKGTYKLQPKATMVNKSKKKLPASYCKEFRYASSDKTVAAVTSAGKIKAVAKGKCTIYVYARNGYTKKVTVTVK